MTRRILFLAAAGLAFASLRPAALVAQSFPTASRDLAPSAFVGLTGTFTGLASSRNLGFTAGADLDLRPIHTFIPGIEFRGTYPIASGQVVGEKSALGGVRVSKPYDRLHPYADLLFGRGALDYQNGGFIVPEQNYLYLRSSSSVISPGVGVTFDLTEHLSARLDGQFQRWKIPFSTGANPAAPGSLYSKAGMIGIVYRLGALSHGHPSP